MSPDGGRSATTLAPRYDGDGLVPAIVQDRRDGRVLMLGWIGAEALAATLETGEVHFHSRSRNRLWRKGETSGNVLRLRSLTLDCDGDALLVAVDPVGPTCHRGTRSCFDPPDAVDVEPDAGEPAAGFGALDDLWRTIVERLRDRPAGSYTAELVGRGVDAVGRKVTEEATEVLIAAKDDAAAEQASSARTATRAALAGELADLVYHALVLLAERDLPPADVLEVLRARRRP